MNDLDDTTFARFAERFARIEHLVPEPPRPAFAPVTSRRPGAPIVTRRAVLLGVVIALTAMFAVAAVGTRPRPTIPPDSAPPAVVLDAYLRALQARDCGTATLLTMPLVLDKSFIDWCAVTRVTAFSVIGDPIAVSPNTVRVPTTLTITGTANGIRAGEISWMYFLQQQASGAWRIVNGAGHVPPSLLPLPTPAAAGSQSAHPQLGGNGWTLTEADGVPLTEETWISFWGGPAGGPTAGDVSSDCSFIPFEYAYDPNGQAITFAVAGENDGSYADGCPDVGLAQYAGVRAALARVVEWRALGSGRLELIDARGAVVLEGGPVPPLPSPPPGGDCGNVALAPCQEAATLAFNFGLFLQPGGRVVSWRVRETIYTACASTNLEPKFDVIFELANPTWEKIATVGESFGKLHACGDY